MNITVYCPSCHTPHHLHATMRGKAIRCTNSVCREVFVVMENTLPAAPEEPAKAPEPQDEVYSFRPENSPHQADPWRPAPQGTSQSGSIEDFVPIVEAEAVPEPDSAVEPPRDENILEGIVPLLPSETTAEMPQGVPSWQEPPPVRKSPPGSGEQKAAPPRTEPTKRKRSKPAPMPAREGATPPPTPPSPEPIEARTLPEAADQPVELPPGAWEAPPVRRGMPEAAIEASRPERSLPEARPDIEAEAPRVARHRARWMIAVLALIGIGGISGISYLIIRAFSETEATLYAGALADYKEGKYPDASRKFDRLLTDYPDSASRPTYVSLKELADLRDEVKSVEIDPLQKEESLRHFLKAHTADPVLKDYQADIAATTVQVAEDLTGLAQEKHDLGILQRAEELLAAARASHPETEVAPQLAKVADTRKDINLWLLHAQLVNEGQKLRGTKVSPEAIGNWWNRVKTTKFERDSELIAVRMSLQKALQGQIEYVKVESPIPPAPAEAVEPSIRVAPLVAGQPARKGASDLMVLALVRGVLYGLAQNNGEIRWSLRVGIDTTRLPLRLPATANSPEERLLVLSADRNTLSAVDTRSGETRWQHRLSAPCLGSPVIVGGRVYVPTLDGRVNEIEIFAGNLLGYFNLGQPLSVGGVWEEGTDRVYFPADSEHVYVLDIAQNPPPHAKGCVAILQTGHPSGSLRSEPIIITRTDPLGRVPDAPGSQNYLILNQADGLNRMELRVFGLPIDRPDAAVLASPVRVRGWSWFRPYHDSEKIAFVADVGTFNLFGVNQVRNEDPPLFPELPEPYDLHGRNARSERAQVVYAEENDFWVLAKGELQRLHFNRYSLDKKIVPSWRKPPTLGAPLHTSQVDTEEHGKVLFLVTQSASEPAYLATAVRAEDGSILWQRQLGLECQGTPLALKSKLLSLDQGGGLFVFDPAKHTASSSKPWETAGQLLAKAIPEGPLGPFLLPGADGTSAYEIACPAQGHSLIVRRCSADGKIEPPESSYRLDAPLAGTPALGPDALIVPLRNGKLYRQPLDGKAGTPGVDWRSPHGQEDAQGHVVGIDGKHFLATDGSRGLKRIYWTGAEDLKEDPNKAELPARIIAPPLVLHREGEAYEVVVADAEGTVTLLEGRTLKSLRQWRTGGGITAGPFLRGDYVGLVRERSHLLWINPSKDEREWEFTTPGEGIVGQPELVKEMLVVADFSGQIIGLDPISGKPTGLPYLIKSGAAPATTPVAFGPKHAFVPLTDGTVFLLPLHQLRHPLLEWPVMAQAAY